MSGNGCEISPAVGWREWEWLKGSHVAVACSPDCAWITCGFLCGPMKQNYGELLRCISHKKRIGRRDLDRINGIGNQYLRRRTGNAVLRGCKANVVAVARANAGCQASVVNGEFSNVGRGPRNSVGA